MSGASPDAGPARELVTRYRAAMASGDRPKARAALADDLHFKGPIDEFHRADDYVAALSKLATIVKAIENTKTFASGDEVAVIYDMVTSTPAGTVTIAEWYRVEAGRIVEIRAIFDSRPFAGLFPPRAPESA